MSIARHHAEWLSLVEVSGPFLSMPVLLRVFPQSLDAHDPEVSRSVRRAFAEWQENQQGMRPDPAIHTAWVRFVLREVLGFPWGIGGMEDGGWGMEGAAQFDWSRVTVTIPEHAELLRPSIVITRPQPDPSSELSSPLPRLLIQIVPPAQDLEKPLKDHRWKASPATRMAELLRGTGVRLGLLTNGERWMLVHAQPGETSGFISWYASLWLDEPVTLRAFRSLLGVARFYGVADADTLEALLTESTANQQEVTDQLGYQVREAVEMLVQTLARIDKDRGHTLLSGVSEPTLYEAALTVMMRLVFLFSAEERDLLLLGKPMYDQHYAISTLRAQLRAAADETGEEVLERRHDAWSRLLATFRAVFGGVQHEDMRLPAYGGDLFDPDRFLFLEGREPESGDQEWEIRDQESGIGDPEPGSGPNKESKAIPAPSFPIPDPRSPIPRPLPVDNRTVLHLLEALQILRVSVPGGGPAEPRRLSFRALDIEQIGHVYEGLLDHTAKRATEPMLGLVGGKDREPEVPLSRLEALRGDGGLGMGDGSLGIGGREEPQGQASLPNPQPPIPNPQPSPNPHPPSPILTFLREATGRSANALANALTVSLTPHALDALRAACDNDAALVARVRPFAGLLRRDTFEFPVVITTGSVFVTAGTDRRTSGTHYTPRSLTEPIVQHTLDPLVYHGPAEGLPKEQWTLHPAERILALQVCDMAMGSGAFLVQACRYLSERLVEAWELYGDGGSWMGDRGSGGGDGGLGSRERRRGQGGVADGNPDVPRSGGVAAEYGFGRGDLSADPAVSEGGTVRPNQPDPTGSGVGASEYRGGVWPDSSQGVHSSPLDSTGFVVGSRDAAPTGGAPNLRGTESGNETLGSAPGSGTAAQWTLAGATGEGRERVAIGAPRSPIPDPRSPDPDPNERLIAARRLIADRCLYGVDKNPLAVEMAKLSLWLITLQKDRPFSFLDHALRCGDSLLGLAHLDQLLHWSLAPDTGPVTATFLTEPLRRAIQRAIALRRRIRETPVRAVRDAEQKARWLHEAEAALGLVRLAADLLVAAALHPDKKQREPQQQAFLDRMFVAAQAFEEVTQGGAGAPKGHANQEALADLRREADALLDGRQPFHWPLEFPEVFDSESSRKDAKTQREEKLSAFAALRENLPGFAAIVGNPPFQGGQKITGALGVPYRDYLVEYLAEGKRGSADLCAYFFLRAGGMLQLKGQAGLIATNTIAQGDSREVGLDQLVARGFALPRAVPSRPWPGLAAVEVAHVWVRRGDWRGPFTLNDLPVAAISPFLTVPGAASGNPYRLKANESKSFQGSIVLGMGFVLEPEEAAALIAKDPRNREALFPYLNGEDLNSRPDQSPSRWVINFHDWPLEKAETYPDLMAIVREKVKPEREKQNDKGGREVWWRFLRPRPELYATITGMERVPCKTRHSPNCAFEFANTGVVFQESLVILAFPGYSEYACLSSNLHEFWAWEYGSTLGGNTLRYSPSDCFETFPFPACLQEESSRKGAKPQREETAADLRAFAALREPSVEAEIARQGAKPPRAENLSAFAALREPGVEAEIARQGAKPPRAENLSAFAALRETLDRIGETYHTHRQSIMLARQEGLTKTYNRFHNPSETAADIAELRRLHVEMDNAVAAAYGWGPSTSSGHALGSGQALDLGHGFHETKQGLRYTISEAARRAVLDRLLALNHARYAEEVEEGLHDPKGSRKAAKPQSRKGKQGNEGQGGMF